MKLALFFFVFLLLSPLLRAQNHDLTLLQKINGGHSLSGEKTFSVLTHSMYPIGMATPVFIFTLGQVKHDKKVRLQGIETAASIGSGFALSFVLKYAIDRERPFDAYPELIHQYTPADSPSFPSGHAAIAFSTATTLSLNFPKWYVIVPSYLWAASVAYSRMYLGVHYPSDIIVGSAIGSLTAIGSHYFFKWIDKRFTESHEALKL